MFVPNDARVAAIDKEGFVIAGELSDPSYTPTVIVDFEYGEGESIHGLKPYYGIFHDETDQWEIFKDPDQSGIIVSAGHKLYDLAEETVKKFYNTIYTGCPGNLSKRLTDAMAREMLAEIDREIIMDLNIASGKVILPPPPLPVIPIPLADRKLKVSWTVDKEDLHTSFSPRLKSSHGRYAHPASL